MNFIGRTLGAARLLISANGPQLAVYGGLVAMTAGAIFTAKQTLNVESILAEHTPDLERIKHGEDLGLETYLAGGARADRTRVYTRVAIDLGKNYAIPASLFVGGGLMVIGGHRLLVQRNAALAVAFTGVKKAFDLYRSRVVDAFGVEADQGMLTGYTKTEVLGQDGLPQVVHKRDWGGAREDAYNRVFEQGESSEWTPDIGINRNIVGCARELAQQKLNWRGYLYLSEVYEALGFEETPESRVVGWKTRRNPDGTKDIPNVDFGLDKPLHDDWKYTQEAAIYLDFNCQGLIVGGNIQRALEQA